MYGFRHVDSETSNRLRHLADRVHATLNAAGIPAFNSGILILREAPELRSIRVMTRAVGFTSRGVSPGN
jgi:hypothetical protein